MNTVVKAHAEHLRAANVVKWDVPDIGQPVWKIILVGPVYSEFSGDD